MIKSSNQSFARKSKTFRRTLKLLYSPFLLSLFFTTIVAKTNAQFIKATVAIDGFTCSMCALGVENAIRQLAFIEDVKMDLNTNTATLYFRKNNDVSIHKIAAKICDAGFSVRHITAEYYFPALTIKDYFVYENKKNEFHFLDIGQKNIEGIVVLSFLNKKLLSKKEYSRNEAWIKEDSKRNGKNDTLYYVTLVRG